MNKVQGTSKTQGSRDKGQMSTNFLIKPGYNLAILCLAPCLCLVPCALYLDSF